MVNEKLIHEIIPKDQKIAFFGNFQPPFYLEYLYNVTNTPTLIIRAMETYSDIIADKREVLSYFTNQKIPPANYTLIYFLLGDNFYEKLSILLSEYRLDLLYYCPRMGIPQKGQTLLLPIPIRNVHPLFEHVRIFKLLWLIFPKIVFEFPTRGITPDEVIEHFHHLFTDSEITLLEVADPNSSYYLVKEPFITQKWIHRYTDCINRFEILGNGIFRKYFYEGFYNQIIEERPYFKGDNLNSLKTLENVDRSEFLKILHILANRGQIHGNLLENIIATKQILDLDDKITDSDKIHFVITDWETVWDLMGQTYSQFLQTRFTRGVYPHYDIPEKIPLAFLMRDVIDINFLLEKFKYEPLSKGEEMNYYNHLYQLVKDRCDPMIDLELKELITELQKEVKPNDE